MTVLKALAYITIVVFLLSCSSSKTDSNDESMPDSLNQKTEKIRPKDFASPDTSKPFAPSTAGLVVEIQELSLSGGEYQLLVKIVEIVGTGAGTPLPSINTELRLTYPKALYNESKYGPLTKGKTEKMLLSFTPSITEGGEQWFCESIGYF